MMGNRGVFINVQTKRKTKVLERVLNDQTIIVEEQIQVKDNKAIAQDSVQTPVNEDSTRHKSSERTE